MNNKYILILLCLLHCNACMASNESIFINQSSKIESNDLTRVFADDGEGFHIELVQRPAEQTSAFYIGRGFDTETIKQYSNTCIFHGTLSNNSTNKVYEVNLSDWYAINKEGESITLNLIDVWIEKWEELNVRKDAQIAFRFSQLPKIQAPGPGDWFQGMISLNLDANETFDLKVIWSESGKKMNKIIKDLKCASK